jgi:2,4'-dihydroxyacetophenone dioxygenase
LLTFVGPTEKESPWVPFGTNAAIRHLAFDVRHNIAGNILWIESAGAIGTHMKLFGWLPGCTEFYDEHGEFVETADVWWYIDHYETFCREHSIAINGQLYL